MAEATRRHLLKAACAASVAAACSSVAAVALAQDVKVIRIGAGPTGSTEFPFGGLVANAISNPPGTRDCDRGGNCGVPGLIAIAQTTAGPVENLRIVARGDMEMSLSQADLASWAFAGSGAFAGHEPMSNLRAIARLFPADIHLAVHQSGPIADLAALRGRRIGIVAEDPTGEATAKLVLSAFGVRNVHSRPLPFAGLTEIFAGHAVDAVALVGGAPVLALQDLARRVPIRVLPLTGPMATKLIQSSPFYTAGVIPVGAYGNSSDVPTIDVGAVLVARDTLDDELAFGIAKAIWHERNAALFLNGHPRGRLMIKGLAASGMSLPLHPGAARYYQSEGIGVPAETPPVATSVRGASLTGAHS